MFDTMSVEIEQLLAKVSKSSRSSGPWNAGQRESFYFLPREEQTGDFTSLQSLQQTLEHLNVFSLVHLLLHYYVNIVPFGSEVW